jgi:2,3-diaminopropionate biosynthesis protein SbnA
MISGGILAAVGSTPLVSLERLYPELPVKLFGKLELLNPGGSLKDRPARRIIEHALESGAITRDSVVVESSSGNMGVGMAQVCAYHGVPFICVTDPKMTVQNREIITAYGARIELVAEPDPVTGDFLAARLKRVHQLLERLPRAFWPNQYRHPMNAEGHRQTAAEIDRALDGCADWLFVSTSTCGTLRGCAEYFRSRGSRTRVMAVDAVGSVIFGGPAGSRRIPGHGASLRPPLFDRGLADSHVLVSDRECVAGCRRLVAREAILAGGSSGGLVSAVARVPRELIAGTTCVLLIHDRGERYLDTIYSDRWVVEHLGAPVASEDRW